MATQIFKFIGKSRYTRVYETDNAFGKSEWKTGLYLDEETKKAYKASGIQKTIKTDKAEQSFPGEDYVEFTRPEFKPMKGVMVSFTPPFVYEGDNKEPSVYYINEDTGKWVFSFDDPKIKTKIVRKGDPILLANGSLIEVTVAVYDTAKGKGQRLEAIRIIDLIPYEKKEQVLKEDVEIEVDPEGENQDAPW